jgi:DNA-binding MarR family transcriptional regulator
VGWVSGSSAAADGSGGEIPLARLLAMAYRHLVDGMHERLVERGWHDVRPAFGFVLLAARERPTTSTDLAALMGTTKQAASKLLDVMEEAGYLTRVAHPGDARAKVVTLSRRGRRLLTVVEEIYGELEAGWAAVLGAARVEAVRRDLRTVLEAEHDGRLPAVRPTW